MKGPILIAAGGTGGHMFPALALGQALSSRGRAVTLITDSRGARYVGGDLPCTVVTAGSPSGGPLAKVRGMAQLARGFVWPATAEDGDASRSYRGSVHMGSLLAIPPDVDVTRLGLSREGLLLAHALQDYGGYVVDRSDCFCLYAEPTLDGTAALKSMRRDLSTLRTYLRVVANNTPSTVGGGGVRRAAPAARTPAARGSGSGGTGSASAAGAR